MPETRCRTPASSGHSTCKVCAGRPFFMRIGVSHASAAPAASSGVSTRGQRRGSRSSTFVSSTTAARRPARRGSSAWPTTSRRTPGAPGTSRLPALKPRCPPTSTAWGRTRPRAWSAGPRRSACTARRRPGRRTPAAPDASSSRSTAGPARDRSVRGCAPCRRRARSGRRAAARPGRRTPRTTPTTSPIESCAPTSWKCTSSAGRPVHGGLGDGQALEHPVRGCRVASSTSAGSAASSIARMSRQVRCGACRRARPHRDHLGAGDPEPVAHLVARR